ncbi:MAG TPA: acetoacetate--CoA ligase [Sphingobium sp.]|uniref:acetoacetate--CoA ligase n=1 Tax=Sphingobium sp. TaxID=1912891 RepID=UPI002ED2758C
MTQEGQLLWTPPKAFVDEALITHFMGWLSENRQLSFTNYQALHEWSIRDPDNYWSAIWGYFEIQSDTPYERVVDDSVMPDTKWFEGSRVNYAEHVLRAAGFGSGDRPAIISFSEVRDRSEMTWNELADKVRQLSSSLRGLGLKAGDRIVSYMPNSPETVIAMLATAAIGAVWSSAAPEFGTAAVVDRFSQIEPKLLFAADGYRFNGKNFDKRESVAEIVEALSTLEHVVWLPYLDASAQPLTSKAKIHKFEDLWSFQLPDTPFKFERVGYDHPLWILYSSGTTGLPKAIVHSHVGMLVTHLSANSFHLNLGPKSRMFFYTTTGWMMFNMLVSALLGGSSIITYDGSPTHPAPDMLWKLVAEAEATGFGASPTFVQGMQKLNIEPGKLFDLSNINFIMCTGSPALPETFEWFYKAVKKDLWMTSSSGGTDICGPIVGSLPILPVYAGEIQCPVLGINAKAFDENGSALIGEIGELVIASPAPCMPLYFWNDPGKRRYRDSYFGVYPGVWRHGDFIRFTEKQASIIYGRSDSTLNRHGVRIGTSEIYRCVEQIPEILDSLVVCLERSPGEYYMPLFVKLKSGGDVDDILRSKINGALRTVCSPRHVPDEIHAVKAIPYTLSGKKMEIPVRAILEGKPAHLAASPDSMADPRALDVFIEHARATVAR